VVEYDLDEEDFNFLQALNETKNKKKEKLSEDQLESLIDFFEKESRKVSFLQHFNPHHPFVFPKEPPPPKCSICNSNKQLHRDAQKDEEEQDTLLVCEKCKATVHENCYGVKLRDTEKPWICSKCDRTSRQVVRKIFTYLPKNSSIETFSFFFSFFSFKTIKKSCIFCPESSGAFKPTIDGRWGHVTCALWIPEVSFEDVETMEPINSISTIPHNRWNQVRQRKKTNQVLNSFPFRFFFFYLCIEMLRLLSANGRLCKVR
jgi:hypothetical protein